MNWVKIKLPVTINCLKMLPGIWVKNNNIIKCTN